MVLCILLFIFLVYDVIPNYYSRNISRKVIKKLNNNCIAITFDDGPDERYTPQLLDLLKKHDVKATFFLVANKAFNNKDLLYRIIREGHEIGLHSLNHKSAWLSSPWYTEMDFSESLRIFKELGINIKFFRPPWGTFNLFTLYNANKNGLKTILWSVEAKDWSSKTTTEDIKNRIMEKIKQGDIIVLHDSNGAEGAPARTIEALRYVIPKLKEQGYNFSTIGQGIGGVEVEQNSKGSI
jgi:peptidoglycan/xylan/chitin deacetylase (PgdA/CDA1 family)